MGKILGIDYGGKRLGLAISDPVVRQAFPREALVGSTMEGALQQLSEWIEEEDVTHVVIGRPVNLSGESTIQTQEVDEFILRLRAMCPSLLITTEDERYTTVQAERLSKTAKKKFKQHADSLAAMLILEQYFSRHDH